MSNIFYSENGEEYSHEDQEEAIYMVLGDMDESGLKKGFVFSIWQGDCNFRKASSYAPDVLEDMANSAYDELSEFSDNWPNVTKEQEKELRDSVSSVIDAWADKYKQQPQFGLMSNCKEIFFKITETAEMTDDIKFEQVEPEKDNGRPDFSPPPPVKPVG